MHMTALTMDVYVIMTMRVSMNVSPPTRARAPIRDTLKVMPRYRSPLKIMSSRRPERVLMLMLVCVRM